MALSGWTRKLEITIAAGQIPTTIINCPVTLTGAAFTSTMFSAMQSDGADLRFTSDDAGNNELARDIQYLDTVAEEIIVHVRIDSLTASTSKTIYAWVGNANAAEPSPRDTSGKQSTWLNCFNTGISYYGVCHLQDGVDSGDLFPIADPGFKSGRESSGNWTAINNDGGCSDDTGPLTGQNAWQLADSNNILNLEAIDTQDSNSTRGHTFEFWYYFTTAPNSNTPIFVGDFNRFLKFDSNGKVKFGDSGSASTANVTTNTWHQRALVRTNAGNVTFILDGSTDGTTSTTQDIENMNRIFMDRNGTGNGLSAMKVAWIRVFRGTEPGTDHYGIQWNSVNNAATFASAGTETVIPVGANVDITNIVDDTEVRVYLGTKDNAASATEIAGEESVIGGTFSFSHNNGGQDAYIQIHKEDYENLRIDLTLPTGDSTIPVQQRFDRNYYNP